MFVLRDVCYGNNSVIVINQVMFISDGGYRDEIIIEYV